MTDKQKASLSQDVVTQILARKRGMCNILELEGRREARGKAIYKRYGDWKLHCTLQTENVSGKEARHKRELYLTSC